MCAASRMVATDELEKAAARWFAWIMAVWSLDHNWVGSCLGGRWIIVGWSLDHDWEVVGS